MTERRVAIVTGASQGMGAALVEALRGEGYAVVATARSIDSSDSNDLLTVGGDITAPDTAERVVGGAIERFGRVDCLVNMAGVHVDKPFTDYTRADFDAMSGVNLLGFFSVTQYVLRTMVQQGSPGRADPLARYRVRVTRHPGQRGGTRRNQRPPLRPGGRTRFWPGSTRSVDWARRSERRRAKGTACVHRRPA